MKKMYSIGIILIVLLSMSGISSAAVMTANPAVSKTVLIGETGQWDIIVTIAKDAEKGVSRLDFDTQNPLLVGKLIAPDSSNSGAAAQTGYLDYDFTYVGDHHFTFEVAPLEHASLVEHSMIIYSDIAGNAIPSVSTIITTPEFPTIALPIAAILGLAFIFQRRKEGD